MEYSNLDAEQLKNLLRQRDVELEQARAVPPAVQTIQLQPNLPLPCSWNIKSKDLAESFDMFLMGWENYKVASSLDNLSIPSQIGVFWSALGVEAMKKCLLEWKFTDDDRREVRTIVEKIKSKLKEQRIPIIDRIRFGECKREIENGETIYEFVERVEKIAQYCNYGDKKDELLLQQVLQGMRDLNFQRELVTSDNLNWTIAKQKIMAKRNADDQLEALNANKNEVAIKKLEIKKDSKSKKKINCKYCGGYHNWDKNSCLAYGAKCNFCKKLNHYEKVCKQKLEKDDTQKTRQVKDKKSQAYSTDKKKSVKKMDCPRGSDSED
jgi:hypothetical protein